MTQAEATARAHALWDADEGITNVQPLPGWPGEWLVETTGRPHILGRDGKPTCHRRCIERAKEMAHG